MIDPVKPKDIQPTKDVLADVPGQVEPELGPETKQPNTVWTYVRYLIAGALVLGGLTLGLLVAFVLNFCLKDCNPTVFQASSIVWAPLGSLLITVPIARIISGR